ncbi:hypothetical protein FACS18949_02030 [Clostridia bacterium]|nr:hypothetical protein FACS18949_02030 [Clostridia bacterium]
MEKEKKQVKRTRDIAVTFRVNAEEHEQIKRRMAQAGVKNMRAFILKQAIDGRVIQVELTSVNAPKTRMKPLFPRLILTLFSVSLALIHAWHPAATRCIYSPAY